MFHWNWDRGQQWRLDRSTVLPAPSALLRHHCSRVSTSPSHVWKSHTLWLRSTQTTVHIPPKIMSQKVRKEKDSSVSGETCSYRSFPGVCTWHSNKSHKPMIPCIAPKHVVLLPPPSDLLPEHRASDECNPNCNVPSPQQRLKYMHQNHSPPKSSIPRFAPPRSRKESEWIDQMQNRWERQAGVIQQIIFYIKSTKWRVHLHTHVQIAISCMTYVSKSQHLL